MYLPVVMGMVRKCWLAKLTGDWRGGDGVRCLLMLWPE